MDWRVARKKEEEMIDPLMAPHLPFAMLTRMHWQVKNVHQRQDEVVYCGSVPVQAVKTGVELRFTVRWFVKRTR